MAWSQHVSCLQPAALLRATGFRRLPTCSRPAMRSRSCRMAPQRRRNRRRSSSICCRWLGVSWIAFRTSRYSSVACSEGTLSSAVQLLQ